MRDQLITSYLKKNKAALGSAIRGMRHSIMCFARGYDQKNIVVHKSSFISRSALLTLLDCGTYMGGKIIVEEGAKICHGVILSPHGGYIVIEKNVYIGPYSVLYGHGGLTIGAGSLLAGQCLLIPSNHNFSRSDIPISQQGEDSKGISIGEDVWLGSGVKVLDGTVIGKGCVVGSGGVVNRSLPDFSVAVGVPARVIKNRTSDCTVVQIS